MADPRINDAALADLDGIYEFGILTFGLKQANEYYDGLVFHFKTIAGNPLSHPAVDDIRAGYRRAPYGAHSIYYRTEENCVEIMRVLGRQNTRKVFDSAGQ